MAQPLLVQQIIEYMTTLPDLMEVYFRRGTRCLYLEYNEDWGIKAFFRKHHCYESFKTQHYLADYEFAPRTLGEPFKFQDYWCYITEIAQTLIDDDFYECFVTQIYSTEYDVRREAIDNTEDEYLQEIHTLQRKIEMETSIIVDDVHIGNVGKIGNRLVWLDFV